MSSMYRGLFLSAVVVLAAAVPTAYLAGQGRGRGQGAATPTQDPATSAPTAATPAPAPGTATPARGGQGRGRAGGAAPGAVPDYPDYSEIMKEALYKVNRAAGQALTRDGGGEVCFGAPMCDWSIGRNTITHEQQPNNLGFTVKYPLAMPDGIPFGPTNAVAVNSKGHIFAFMRQNYGSGAPQLAEWDANYKFVKAWGPGIAVRAHGMKIDAQDNIWVADQSGPTVMQYSPEGKLLKTIGVKGQSGTWDEAKGQRLLWQPLDIAFAPNGDIYIGEGHANESTNDGAPRIIHLDKNGNFIGQWYGNRAGQGHFAMVHGLAINPNNGDVYIGDREEYRIVVYTGDGKFVKTMQMRNLVCALYVDPHKQLWMASGQDGQVFKLDWDGKILGAMGNGQGRGEGQFVESTYMGMDLRGDLFVGDTSVGRVTQFVAPK